MATNGDSGNQKLNNHSDDHTTCGADTCHKAAVRKPAPPFKGMAYWDKKF